MEILLALGGLVLIVFFFALFRSTQPVERWSDAELQHYLDANGTRHVRLMIDGFTNPAKRRQYELLDPKYREIEAEWNRRKTAPATIGPADRKWLVDRKDFVATAAKSLGVSEDEASKQIIELRKKLAMKFAGRSFDKKGNEEFVDKVVRESFNPGNIEADRKKREHMDQVASMQREFVAKGLSEEKAREQTFVRMRSEAEEKKKAEERTSAEQGDANAQYAMGLKALQADDLDAALEWLNKAADQGHVKAVETIFEKSFIRPISDERRQALILVMANGGNPIYQCMIADNLLKQGDSGQARQWLEKAVSKNNARAMYLLGKMLEDGNGVENNHAAALDYYQKSASQGYGLSQFQLATCYERGYGVPQDLRLAYLWYTLAMRAGVPAAFEKVGGVIKGMTPEQLEEAKALTADWNASEA